MASLADQLLSLLGPDRVSTTQADLATHSTDKWFASHPPEVVVHAQNVDDVSKTLRFANEHKIPVTPQGARVGYVGGCVPSRGGIALSLLFTFVLVPVLVRLTQPRRAPAVALAPQTA